MTYSYERLPWEQEVQDNSRPEAVALVDAGKERILDAAKLEELGGAEGLSEEVMAVLAGKPSTTDGVRQNWYSSGFTHVLLPDHGSNLSPILSSLLLVVAPTLVVLDISDNGLFFLPEVLRHCTTLEEFNISSNPLKALPSWLGDLTGLRMLVVDRCGLQNLPQELAHLTALHTICGT
jgi:Leucine-rich repeat (LRR) protein